MTFDPQPAPSGATLSGTRDQIRTNFEVIQSRFEDDHTEYGSGSGKHDKSTYPEQTTIPTTAANEGAVYTKQVSSATGLFFREESNGTQLQLTDPARVIAAAEGSLQLPGGLIMKWGTKDSPGVSGSVAFATAYPTAVFQVQITLQHSGSGAETYTIQGSTPPTTAGFNYTTSSSGASSKLFWYALGN